MDDEREPKIHYHVQSILGGNLIEGDDFLKTSLSQFVAAYHFVTDEGVYLPPLEYLRFVCHICKPPLVFRNDTEVGMSRSHFEIAHNSENLYFAVEMVCPDCEGEDYDRLMVSFVGREYTKFTHKCGKVITAK